MFHWFVAIWMLGKAPVTPQEHGFYVLAPHLFITTAVRDKLAADWQDSPDPFPEDERGYCVRFLTRNYADGTVEYTLTDVWKGVTIHAEPGAITFICPQGPDIAMLHTHPNQTNKGHIFPNDSTMKGKYELEGLEARECYPSQTDYNSLLHDPKKHPFALIQCGSRAIVPYFRVPYIVVPY